jgi:hypothetical protein
LVVVIVFSPGGRFSAALMERIYSAENQPSIFSAEYFFSQPQTPEAAPAPPALGSTPAASTFILGGRTVERRLPRNKS